jgi:hypothetical protein
MCLGWAGETSDESTSREAEEDLMRKTGKKDRQHGFHT